MKSKTFVFYNSWIDGGMEHLSGDECKNIMMNIKRHQEGDEIILNTVGEKILWAQMLPLLESNKSKYDNIVERNQTNGKKGGRPKKNPNNPMGFSGIPTNPTLTQQNLEDVDDDVDDDDDVDKDVDVNKEVNKELKRKNVNLIYKSNKTEIEYIRDLYSMDLDDAVDYFLQTSFS